MLGVLQSLPIRLRLPKYCFKFKILRLLYVKNVLEESAVFGVFIVAVVDLVDVDYV